MNKYHHYFYRFILVIILSGCTPTLYTSTNEEKKYEPTDVSDISITTNDSLENEYKEIGFVSTSKTVVSKAKKELKKYAAKVGGNAIINFKINIIRSYVIVLIFPIPIDHYICSGTVIKII